MSDPKLPAEIVDELLDDLDEVTIALVSIRPSLALAGLPSEIGNAAEDAMLHANRLRRRLIVLRAEAADAPPGHSVKAGE